jgi:dipeptidyl aminopeptidase/acylaminoacyl peptidase
VFPWEADGWTHLYSVPVAGGVPATLLTPGAFEVEHAALMTGGRQMIFSSNQGDTDRRHLWKVDVAGGAAVAFTSGTGIEAWPTPTSDPGAVAFLHGDARTPLQAVVRIGAETRNLDAHSIPADFPLKSLVEPQQVIFSSADGMPIHGQLFLPAPHAAKPAPAVVFFHGGPQRQMLLGWSAMYYYWNAYAMNQYLAACGYVVLSVNYRSGIGYGLDFREALHFGASGASEYNDVQGAGLYLRSRADVDPARIGAWGGSYGGYLTALALARSSDLFKAGVDFHGVHDWARELGIPVTEPDYKVAFEASPMASVNGWKSPVLLIHGDDDRNVEFNQTVMLANALRSRHVPMELIVYPDEIHDFLLYRTWLAAYQATARFLDRQLK